MEKAGEKLPGSFLVTLTIYIYIYIFIYFIYIVFLYDIGLHVSIFTPRRLHALPPLEW